MKNIFTFSIIQDKEEKKEYRWHVSITLLLLFIIGSVLNIPFGREVKRLSIEAGNTGVKLNDSIITDLSTIGISSLILGAVLVFIGLWVSSSANMGAPIIARLFSEKQLNKIISIDAVISSVLLASLIAIILGPI